MTNAARYQETLKALVTAVCCQLRSTCRYIYFINIIHVCLYISSLRICVCVRFFFLTSFLLILFWFLYETGRCRSRIGLAFNRLDRAVQSSCVCRGLRASSGSDSAHRSMRTSHDLPLSTRNGLCPSARQERHQVGTKKKMEI